MLSADSTEVIIPKGSPDCKAQLPGFPGEKRKKMGKFPLPFFRFWTIVWSKKPMQHRVRGFPPAVLLLFWGNLL